MVLFGALALLAELFTFRKDNTMKKIIFLIIIATTLVISFASCGNSKNNETNEPETNNVRTTITAEEWAALETYINYTRVMTTSQSYTVLGETQTQVRTETLKSTATAEYQLDSYTYNGETETDECYCVIKDERTYRVRKNEDGNWVASTAEWDADPVSEVVYVDREMTFASLTYDETTKAYTYTTILEDGLAITCNYYFEDGILLKLDAVMSGENEGAVVEATVTMVISNIGTTLVNPPANITYPEL